MSSDYKLTRDLCKDCGTTSGMDWWIGRHSVKPDGCRPTAAARCHSCYNAMIRLRQRQPKYKRKAQIWQKQKKAPRCHIWCKYCKECCSLFIARSPSTSRCASCQTVATTKRRSLSEARRRDAYKNGDSSITWRSLGERDGWKCHLCKKKVMQVAGAAKIPHGATVDHLIPIAVGGVHEWHNVALAHRQCNLQRIHVGPAQLILIG